MQTTYETEPAIGFPGMIAKNGPCDTIHKHNEDASGLPYGIAVARGTANKDVGAKLPTSASDEILGVTEHSVWANNQGLPGAQGIATGDMFNLLTEGFIFVVPEQDVTPTDSVFVRYSVSTTEQLGAFRKDGDGTAQVTTITPTAANTTNYQLEVNAGGKQFTFVTTSDADATATEIVTAFKALMAADASFSALIAASGTTTLILTSLVAGEAFSVASEGPGVLAIAATTPSTSKARRLKGARWDSSAAAGTPAVLKIVGPVDPA